MGKAMPPPLHNVVVISRAGGPEVLTCQRRQLPEPADNQVLIKVHTAGVNRHDCGQRLRGPNDHESDIPGLEVSGHIVSRGGNVSHIEVGAAVCALVDGGGYGQYVVADASNVLPAPPAFSLREAATVPEAAFTAWYNFFNVGALQPNEIVLIHGGTSGVGVFSIQLLRSLGHTVFVTCGTDEKADVARSLGANEAFNYRTGDFAQRLKDKGLSVDVILDMSGGRYMDQNLSAVSYGGRIVHLSPGGDNAPQVSLRKMMEKEVRITGSLMRPLAPDRKAKVAQALLNHVWPLLGQTIRPVVSQVFPLEDAYRAHQLLESGNNIGKILLEVPA